MVQLQYYLTLSKPFEICGGPAKISDTFRHVEVLQSTVDLRGLKPVDVGTEEFKKTAVIINGDKNCFQIPQQPFLEDC